jgi:chorismate mutase/prephenate dehydratase
VKQGDGLHPSLDLAPGLQDGIERSDALPDLDELEVIDFAQGAGKAKRQLGHPRARLAFLCSVVLETHCKHLCIFVAQPLERFARYGSRHPTKGTGRPASHTRNAEATLGWVPDSKRQLDELRQEIAKLDLQVLAALDRRARAARRLGELRKGHAPQLPVADQAAVRALVARSTGDMPAESLRTIFREIFGACLILELPVAVAYVGPEGGPGHAAASGRFSQGATLLGTEATAGAIEEVSRRRAEFAVVPFETSMEGPVKSTILALMASDLRIAEMLETSFDLHLMNKTGSSADVEKVYATPADHALCERFLSSHPANVAVIDVRAPRMACELAAREEKSAALANEIFGAQFGLEVAQRSVLDRGGDRIRYAVVGARPSGRTNADVTTLVFTVQDAAGSLLDVLAVLAERGINLTNIHSHPVRDEAWNYLFCVEVAGHFTDRPLVSAFEEMKRKTRSFRVLGSYPAP